MQRVNQASDIVVCRTLYRTALSWSEARSRLAPAATLVASLLFTQPAPGAPDKAAVSGPVTEIRVLYRLTGLSIEREVTFRPEDAARVELRKGYPARRTRTVKGRLVQGTFKELAGMLETAGFRDLDDEYAVKQLHEVLCVIAVKYRHGKRTVHDYGEAGPPALIKFESTAHELLERIAFK